MAAAGPARESATAAVAAKATAPSRTLSLHDVPVGSELSSAAEVPAEVDAAVSEEARATTAGESLRALCAEDRHRTTGTTPHACVALFEEIFILRTPAT
jgi:hypothetical protein